MKKSQDPFNGCARQVHLDFHNSPWIPDLLAQWDPQELARQFRDARVNSVVVFAKCVHGMGYYPSSVVEPHPALAGRDFTGEMIEALHAEGIRAPIYTIVGWEEHLARHRPEWLQLCEDGTFAQNEGGSDGFSKQPGRFYWLNFLHPDYQAYFEAHLQELLERYPIDGLFIDMLVVHPRGDYSETAMAFRRKHGLQGTDPLTHARFEARAQQTFAKRFTRQIRKTVPGTAIFYNSENRLYTRADLGAVARASAQTHFEIESLPAGMWNYQHFPRVARNLRARGPWLGMTGRFQQMWGDFGGIKPVPALEFECFRTQAMGGANSVGDQLHPRGTLDAGAYQLIKGVFAQCEEAEPFYAGATTCPTVAALCPHDPETDAHASTLVEEGMSVLCQEDHYDLAIVNEADDLSTYAAVLIGEGTRISPCLREKLGDYVENGGALLATGDTVFDEDGKGWGPFQGLQRLGPACYAPAYLRARGRSPLSAVLGEDERVFYSTGPRVKAGRPWHVWAERVVPYFQRSDLRFCSHFQAPPDRATGESVMVQKGPVVYCADPLFGEYRQSANPCVPLLFRKALEHLIGVPPYGDGLKRTVRLFPLRKKEDLLLTLLHYLPERKSQHDDVIQERLGFGEQCLRMPPHVECVRVWRGPDCQREPDGSFRLPVAEGRLLLEVPCFFAKRP